MNGGSRDDEKSPKERKKEGEKVVNGGEQLVRQSDPLFGLLPWSLDIHIVKQGYLGTGTIMGSLRK